MASNSSRTPENDDVLVASANWADFLDTFTRQHRGWLATIEIAGKAAVEVEARECPLQAVSIDPSGAQRTAYIETGTPRGGSRTHTVTSAVSIVFLRTASGAHRGLSIVGADGTVTTVRFRSPAVPEMLDGIAAA